MKASSSAAQTTWNKIGVLGRSLGLKGACYLKTNFFDNERNCQKLKSLTVLIGQNPEVSGFLTRVSQSYLQKEKLIVSFQDIKI